MRSRSNAGFCKIALNRNGVVMVQHCDRSRNCRATTVEINPTSDGLALSIIAPKMKVLHE
jgi:hypothetical protein